MADEREPTEPLVIVPRGRIGATIDGVAFGYAPLVVAGYVLCAAIAMRTTEDVCAAAAALAFCVVLWRQAEPHRWACPFSARGRLVLESSTVSVYIGDRRAWSFDTRDVALLRGHSRLQFRRTWYSVELSESGAHRRLWLWATTARPVGPLDQVLDAIRRDSNLVPDTHPAARWLLGRDDWVRAVPHREAV